MKPPRYTGTPVGGGERVQGQKLHTREGEVFIVPTGIRIFRTQGESYAHLEQLIEVDPTTVEPVRMPVAQMDVRADDGYYCPECGEPFCDAICHGGRYYNKQEYCHECGQALEWPEDKEG